MTNNMLKKTGAGEWTCYISKDAYFKITETKQNTYKTTLYKFGKLATELEEEWTDFDKLKDFLIDMRGLAIYAINIMGYTLSPNSDNQPAED